VTPGPRTADEPDEVARLLTVPLSAFVEERKRLAAALKSVGRRDEAQQLAKLAKPSVAVWVVNQLARSDGALLQRLGEVSGAMRTAPRRPRAGARPHDAGSDYAGLLAQHRDTLRALRLAAERILAASQLGASPAVLERITHTLRAGMADDETRATILRGRLLRDVGDVDFANLVGAGAGDDAGAGAGGVPHDGEPHHARPTRIPAAAPPPLTRAPAAKPATAASSDQVEARAHAARERQQAAETAAQERTRAREAAARERERERAHTAAKREVERLRAKADTARQRVAAAEETARGLASKAAPARD
jgi:hypothetical protein